MIRLFVVRSSLLFTIGIILAGCGSIPVLVGEPPRPTTARERPLPAEGGTQQEHGLAVAEAALALVASQPRGRAIRVGERRYPLDCSGTILAAHHLAGVDILPEFSRESGNGVARLWSIGAESAHRTAPGPAPGDVIFWDNSFDRNRNGLWDDELTHAGIVVAVDGDGTISYVHHHYRLGIVVEEMNLDHPDDRERNSAMRMRGQPDPSGQGRKLASHLYRDSRALY